MDVWAKGICGRADNLIMVNTVIQFDGNGQIVSVFQVESTRDAHTWFRSAVRYFCQRKGHVLGFFANTPHGKLEWRRTPEADIFDGPVLDSFVW